MRAILLICVLYVHTYIVQASTSQDVPKMEELWQRKCESNAGNAQAYNNFMEGCDGIYPCFLNAVKNDVPDPLEHHEDYCRFLRESTLYECVSNFTDIIGPCFDETEAYLPDFILTMVNTTYNEACGVNGFSNFEYLFKTFNNLDVTINTCLKRAVELLWRDANNYSNLTVYRNVMDNFIINLNAKDVCSDLRSILKSFSLLMKQECNEDYSRFVDLYSQPFLAECNILHN